MFKISKKFKLFSNIKSIATSSLIVCAIFSSVSLSALEENEKMIEDAVFITKEATNLCYKMKTKYNEYEKLIGEPQDMYEEALRKESQKNLDDFLSLFDSKFRYIKHLSLDHKSKDTAHTKKLEEFDPNSFYKYMYESLLHIKRLINCIYYDGKYADRWKLKHLLIQTKGYVIGLELAKKQFSNEAAKKAEYDKMMQKFIYEDISNFDRNPFRTIWPNSCDL